jgi:hypothetical protein
MEVLIRQIEPEAQAPMGFPVVAPKQDIIPVAAEAEQSVVGPKILDITIKDVGNYSVCRIDGREIKWVVEVVDC